MTVTPREPDAATRPTERPSPERRPTEVRAEVRAPTGDTGDGQRPDETVEEPGYGHGV